MRVVTRIFRGPQQAEAIEVRLTMITWVALGTFLCHSAPLISPSLKAGVIVLTCLSGAGGLISYSLKTLLKMRGCP